VRFPTPPIALVVVVVATSSLVLACSSVGSEQATAPRGDCPVTPIRVVVTVDQWADMTHRLAGDCASVTTIIKGSKADPHEYEPTPADTAAFDRARVVVLNGLGYDSWASRAIDNLDRKPIVVDAGKVAGRHDGENPHVWYSPEAVRGVAAATTAAMIRAMPSARGYLEERQARWQASLVPYDAEVAAIRAHAAGRRIAATEPVFDDMAVALGLEVVTPPGYERSARNETDATPADVAAFERLLSHHGADALVVNTQTEGAAPSEIRAAAHDDGVPVVEVTETVPPGRRGFVDWQVRQLRALAEALHA
jgi:zinc/manganese transport system substrate-binding protein